VPGSSSATLGDLLKSLVVICVALVVAASCAVVSHDVTNDAVASNISGKCFVTQKPLYLVHTGGWGVPDQLSVTNGANTCRADGSYLGMLPKCGVTWKSDVPSGTELIVTKVTDKAKGESGRCWSVQGRFKDTQLHASDFDVPSCNFESFSKSWLNEWTPDTTYRTGAKLAFDPELLRSCDSPSAP
jgi:hypothetical protein